MPFSELAALMAEFRRLGLEPKNLPGLATGLGGQAALLARLRELSPGVTWRDVFPELPVHWTPGRPETWSTAYRPYGAYDYQELQTAAAVQLCWEKPGEPDHLERLVAAAREAKWPVYGAGLMDIKNPNRSTMDAMVVLRSGTTEDELGDFTTWLEAQEVTIVAIPRLGNETYSD